MLRWWGCFFLGSLFLTALELSSTKDEHVETVITKEYEDEDMEDARMEEGVYRKKHFHFGNHVPAIISKLFPEGALNCTEEAWDCFPFRKSIFTSDYLGEKFRLEVQTMVCDDDRGDNPNALSLSEKLLAKREIDFVDIVADDKTGSLLEGPEDPTKFKSKKTGKSIVVLMLNV